MFTKKQIALGIVIGIGVIIFGIWAERNEPVAENLDDVQRAYLEEHYPKQEALPEFDVKG